MGCLFSLGAKPHFNSLDVMSPQDKIFSILIHEVPLLNAELGVLCAVSATKIIGPVF